MATIICLSEEAAKQKRCWNNLGNSCLGNRCMAWTWRQEYSSENKEYYDSAVIGFCRAIGCS